MLVRLFLVLYALWVGSLVAIRRLFHGPARPGWNLRFETAVDLVRRLIRRGAPALQTGGPVVGYNPPLLGPNPRTGSRVHSAGGQLAGLATEVHTPAKWQPGHATLLYFHGGGYVSCSPATHRGLLRQISHAAAVRCIAPDYRKAPAHVFPAAVNDALACYRALLVEGVDPRRLFVGGDSAGGGLALALLLRLRDAGEPLPRAALLLSPWVDLECSFETLHSHAIFDYLSHDLILGAAQLYAGETSLQHPLISPLHAELAGLPPLLVQTGGVEVFNAENIAFVAKARAAGVEVTHEISDHMVHVFQAFTPVLSEGKAAIRSLGSYVRTRTYTMGDAERAPGAPPEPQKPSVALQR